jgi:ribose-phosphate pyrophosphokinase
MIKLNDVELEFETYPNGETKVNGKQIHNNMKQGINRIAFKYENDDDLIKLFFVKNYLNEYKQLTSLLIHYMPYSRMDRIENRSVFTLKYVCNLINSLGFSSVDVVEPHSDVTPALLDRCTSVYPTINLLKQVMIETGFDVNKDFIFFPDAGASKRYSKELDLHQLVGYKKRDFDTGEITQLEVMGDIQEKGFKTIIIDDICSYGGTFIRSSKKLKELGASEIYLLVAHCEESIFKGEIFNSGLVAKVFTTNSIIRNSSVSEFYREKIKIYEIEESICDQ